MTITRVIKASVILCKVFDTEKDEIKEKEITLSGDKGTDTKSPKLLDEIRKYFKREKIAETFLSVKSIEIKQGLYALEEAEFLKYAKRIGDGR